MDGSDLRQVFSLRNMVMSVISGPPYEGFLNLAGNGIGATLASPSLDPQVTALVVHCN